MDLLHRRLAGCQRTGELVAINRWPDYGAILVGKILELNSKSVKLQLIGSAGQLEEVEKYSLREIHSIERGGAYLKGLEFLSRNQSRISKGNEQSGWVKSRLRVSQELRKSLEEGTPVRLRRKGDTKYLQILVVSFEDQWVEAVEYGDGGVLKETHVFPVQDITKLRWGTQQEAADSLLIQEFGQR